MADNSLTSAASLLYEMQGKMMELYPKDYVFLAELSGVDVFNGGDPAAVEGRITPDLQPDSFYRTYSGLRVRVPIQPTGLQGAQAISETGTVNVPIAVPFSEAHITLGRVVAPTSLTLDIDEDSMDNSAVQMAAQLAKGQRLALAEVVNDMLLGNGDAQLAVADSTQSSAGGLTLKVDATTDFDKLYPGRVVDVLATADGSDPGQGKRRLIASINETASPPTVTFSTTAQASDGGSGNITLSNAVGVYLPGSYGNALQGVEQAAATSGTFEGIDKAANVWWKGTDGRQGTTTTAPLSDLLIDTAVLLGQRAGVSKWDFGVGDPKTINVYKNGKTSLLRYDAPTTTLRSGFKGIIYDGLDQELPLVPERRHKVGGVKLIRRDRMTLYGRRKGPAYEDSTGSPWQRFARSLPRESWYVDRLNLGVHDCGAIVFLNNLSTS
jgi:hypothetical protein